MVSLRAEIHPSPSDIASSPEPQDRHRLLLSDLAGAYVSGISVIGIRDSVRGAQGSVPVQDRQRGREARLRERQPRSSSCAFEGTSDLSGPKTEIIRTRYVGSSPDTTVIRSSSGTRGFRESEQPEARSNGVGGHRPPSVTFHNARMSFQRVQRAWRMLALEVYGNTFAYLSAGTRCTADLDVELEGVVRGPRPLRARLLYMYRTLLSHADPGCTSIHGDSQRSSSSPHTRQAHVLQRTLSPCEGATPLSRHRAERTTMKTRALPSSTALSGEVRSPTRYRAGHLARLQDAYGRLVRAVARPVFCLYDAGGEEGSPSSHRGYGCTSIPGWPVVDGSRTIIRTS
ncbi:hypothetical protein B0H13DRAFT_2394211 [Mycena leptocephala]|nr:hypothetical protein B0H13DRAFT_2394211 [Mycena leptocephala]